MPETLALHGGRPVRDAMLPYGRHSIDETDIEAVAAVLRSDWLTTGSKVGEFERAFADLVGTREAVTVSSGTAALHAAMYALGVGPGDEVIVPAMTFAATANCVVYQGGTPVFVDVNPDTLLLDAAAVERKITRATKAIVSVDYAGHPCDYDILQQMAARFGLTLVDDACHSLGGFYQGKPVGSLALLNVFSLHPVKHITTGEGGVITTDDPELARRMRSFRNHGINHDHHQREREGSWVYAITDLGYNYRLTDIQCALGLSQLQKLTERVLRRQQIAHHYDAAFADLPGIRPLARRDNVVHAYHLYVVRLDPECLRADRATIFKALRAEGIGVNVHYIPVHLHPFYSQRFGLGPGLCPVAEAAYQQLLSLPIFPAMSDADGEDVVTAVEKVIHAYARVGTYQSTRTGND